MEQTIPWDWFICKRAPPPPRSWSSRLDSSSTNILASELQNGLTSGDVILFVPLSNASLIMELLETASSSR
jgi:hypothetical protein